MSTSKRGPFGTSEMIVGLVALLLIGGFLYFVIKEQKVGPALNAPAVVATDTYTNDTWAFSLQYPKGMRVYTKDYDYIHPFNIFPVAYLRFINDQTEGYLTMNVSLDPEDVYRCAVAGADYWINGLQYKRLTAGKGGVNGFSREYQFVRNGACYDIETFAFAGSCTNGCEKQTWSDRTEQDMLDQLDTYVHTFAFTK